MLDLWYKNAVIYCLDPEFFMDSDGDGVGDFKGLEHRLDHIEALGATAVWLNPFYPTPNRDNGYDISDFYGVDPRLGTPGDFVAFSRAAADRGLKVIVDLVVNHTSVEHPWFQKARADRDSPYRDYYVWSDEKPADIAEGIIFPGVQEAVWTWDEVAQSWYMHRFYEHQADLNIANPAVREEIFRVMGYWLELGVWGFRVDAVPFLIEYKGLHEEPDRDPMLLLSEMRDFLSWRRAGAIMMAEANVDRERVPDYFGGRSFGQDERMHMVLDFPLNQAIWLAFAREDAGPVRKALASRPEGCEDMIQWANFLRNHDELSLDKLTEAERQEVYAVFAPDEDMRIYRRGIRRRLGPMLNADDARIALAHSILFALPGTPVMWFGDEIGQGEDLSLPERSPVRTPMQWADEPNGGFSLCAEKTVHPVVENGPSGFHARNVAAQRAEPDSLLHRVMHLIRSRRACPEIGWGRGSTLDGLPDAVLGLETRWEGDRMVSFHNFSGAEQRFVPEIAEAGRLSPLLADGGDRSPQDEIRLEPYGYRWFRVDGERR